MFDLERAVGIDGMAMPTGRIIAGLVRRGGDVSNPVGVTFWPAGTHAPRDVTHTRRLVAHTLNRREVDLRLMRQVHARSVVRRHTGESWRNVPTADAQYTTDPGPLLIANVADCCPVVLVAPAVPMVGIAHAGWRGTADGVVSALIHAMVSHGAAEGDLAAWIGPCAEGRRYEVGREVAERFSPWPDALAAHPTDPSKHLLDVRAVLRDQLAGAGVDARRTWVSTGGTIGDSRYHSHRRSSFAAGRMAAFVSFG